MIMLFTDFGLHGPYTGQMKAVLLRMAPGIPALDGTSSFEQNCRRTPWSKSVGECHDKLPDPLRLHGR